MSFLLSWPVTGICLGAAQGLWTQKYFGDDQSEMKMLSQQGEGWVSSADTLAQASVPGECQLNKHRMPRPSLYALSSPSSSHSVRAWLRSRLPGDLPTPPNGGLTCLHVAQVLVWRVCHALGSVTHSLPGSLIVCLFLQIDEKPLGG